jgi:hypothetical protein
MAAWQPGMQICVKVVNVFDGDLKHGLPNHLAVVDLFDPHTGAVTCVMDATYITGIRTAAAAMLPQDGESVNGSAFIVKNVRSLARGAAYTLRAWISGSCRARWTSTSETWRWDTAYSRQMAQRSFGTWPCRESTTPISCSGFVCRAPISNSCWPERRGSTFSEILVRDDGVDLGTRCSLDRYSDLADYHRLKGRTSKAGRA